jgi:hypothetical protein
MSYQKRVECKYGCEEMLYWDTDEGFYREDESDERHICPNFSSHNPTAKSRDSIIKCKNEGCGIQLFWKKGERQPYEKDTGIKHICKAWIDKQNALHGTGAQSKLLQTSSPPQITRTEEVIKTSPTLDQYSETNIWLRGIMELLKEIRDNIEVNNKYTRMVWEEMKSFTEEQDTTTTTKPKLAPNPLEHLDFKEQREGGDDIYDEIADTDDHSRDA